MCVGVCVGGGGRGAYERLEAKYFFMILQIEIYN